MKAGTSKQLETSTALKGSGTTERGIRQRGKLPSDRLIVTPSLVFLRAAESGTIMSNLGEMIRFFGVAGGLSLVTTVALAAEGSKVIRDQQWTIQIRPKNGPVRSEPVDEARFRTTRITPAVFQQPEQEATPVAPRPTPGAVQPAPAPTPSDAKTDGPRLSPSNNSEGAVSPLDLVPTVMPACVINYDQAYASIPFSRTEYEANPQYRHQAALELMFHTLRPTTLVQNYTPRAFRYPDSYQIPYGRSDTQHINIRNFGSGPNYNGQSPFGYPYGLKGNW